MSRTTRKLVATVSALALLGGSAAGVATAAQSSSTSTGTSSSKAQRDQRPPRITNAQLEQIASKVGVTTTALKAALDANKPAKPTGTAKRAGFAADIAKALGVETSAVQAVLDANKPAKGSKPDPSKLVSALATALDLETSKVQTALDGLRAAHDADRDAKRTAMTEAVAKTLGVSASDLQAAFDAVLPQPPAKA